MQVTFLCLLRIGREDLNAPVFHRSLSGRAIRRRRDHPRGHAKIRIIIGIQRASVAAELYAILPAIRRAVARARSVDGPLKGDRVCHFVQQYVLEPAQEIHRRRRCLGNCQTSSRPGLSPAPELAWSPHQPSF